LDPENLDQVEDTYNWRGADVVLDEQGEKLLCEFINNKLKGEVSEYGKYQTEEAIVYHAYMENGLKYTFNLFSKYTWQLVCEKLSDMADSSIYKIYKKVDLSMVNLMDILNVKMSTKLGIFQNGAIRYEAGNLIKEPTIYEARLVLWAEERIRENFQENMEMVCGFKANMVTWSNNNGYDRNEELTTLNYMQDNLYKFENGDILIARYGYDGHFSELKDRVENIKRATALASIAGERSHALFLIKNDHQSDSTLDILFDRYQTLDNLYPTMEERIKTAHIEAEICLTITEAAMGTWVRQAFVEGYNEGSSEANLAHLARVLSWSEFKACEEENREAEINKQISELESKAESIKEEARRLEDGHVAPASEARNDRFVKTGRMSASEIAEAMDEEDDFIDTKKMWDEVDDLYNEANELQKDLEFDAWYLIDK
jgi:predicted RNA-binding protein with PIN domain